MQMAKECKDRPVGQGVAHLRTSKEVAVAVQEYNSTCSAAQRPVYSHVHVIKVKCSV